MKTIIRKCDKCGNEDSINCESGFCVSCENKVNEEQILAIQLLEKQNKNLRKAFNLLMDYFDFIPEEERESVSNKLEKWGY